MRADVRRSTSSRARPSNGASISARREPASAATRTRPASRASATRSTPSGAHRVNALAARVKQLVDDATRHAAQLGDFDGAEARCKRGLAASPGDPWALNALALVYRSTGRLPDAERAQAHAVAVRPNNPSLLYNLAEIHRARGDLARARATACSARSSSRRISPPRRRCWRRSTRGASDGGRERVRARSVGRDPARQLQSPPPQRLRRRRP